MASMVTAVRCIKGDIGIEQWRRAPSSCAEVTALVVR